MVNVKYFYGILLLAGAGFQGNILLSSRSRVLYDHIGSHLAVAARVCQPERSYNRGPQGRIAKAVFEFGLGDDWLKGAKMVRELEGTISTPQVGSLLKGLVKAEKGRSYPSRSPGPQTLHHSCLTTFEGYSESDHRFQT